MNPIEKIVTCPRCKYNVLKYAPRLTQSVTTLNDLNISNVCNHCKKHIQREFEYCPCMFLRNLDEKQYKKEKDMFLNVSSFKIFEISSSKLQKKYLRRTVSESYVDKVKQGDYPGTSIKIEPFLASKYVDHTQKIETSLDQSMTVKFPNTVTKSSKTAIYEDVKIPSPPREFSESDSVTTFNSLQLRINAYEIPSERKGKVTTHYRRPKKSTKAGLTSLKRSGQERTIASLDYKTNQLNEADKRLIVEVQKKQATITRLSQSETSFSNSMFSLFEKSLNDFNFYFPKKVIQKHMDLRKSKSSSELIRSTREMLYKRDTDKEKMELKRRRAEKNREVKLVSEEKTKDKIKDKKDAEQMNLNLVADDKDLKKLDDAKIISTTKNKVTSKDKPTKTSKNKPIITDKKHVSEALDESKYTDQLNLNAKFTKYQDKNDTIKDAEHSYEKKIPKDNFKIDNSNKNNFPVESIRKNKSKSNLKEIVQKRDEKGKKNKRDEKDEKDEKQKQKDKDEMIMREKKDAKNLLQDKIKTKYLDKKSPPKEIIEKPDAKDKKRKLDEQDEVKNINLDKTIKEGQTRSKIIEEDKPKSGEHLKSPQKDKIKTKKKGTKGKQTGSIENEDTTGIDLKPDDIKIRNSSSDDLILRLVKLKQIKSKNKTLKTRRLTNIGRLYGHKTQSKDDINLKPINILHTESELEVEKDFSNIKESENMDMIVGQKIFKHKSVAFTKPTKQEGISEYYTVYNEEHNYLSQKESSVDNQGKQNQKEKEPINTAVRNTPEPQQEGKGVIRYALSDRTFIDKGWTMLPIEKVVRKMNVYRMRPAHPEFDWFEHNKNKKLMTYDTGERLAEFDDDGKGRWFYKNGRLALEYYDSEELNTQQRIVIYSNGEPDERGRSRPLTILATFDYLGNGVVFDHTGKIRLKYNQTEGVVLDRDIGPVSHWKWHTLNDPPVLQQVMIDIQMTHKDPDIAKLGPSTDTDRTKVENEEMLAIEFDNFIKEKSKKLSQKFKPFQIKMKALKINEHFSLKILDQATVYLIYRDGSTNLKLNIGMILDHQEIVDTDTAEVGEVSNSLERFPAKTDSLAGLQRSVEYAQRQERARLERDRRLRPKEPCASADKLTAAISKPLKPRLYTIPSACTRPVKQCCYKYRTPCTNLYYDTRLI